MTPKEAWGIYFAFVAYWWIAAAWTLARFKRDPTWVPGGIIRLEQQFKIKISKKTWAWSIVGAAVLVSVSGFWFPHLLIDDVYK